VRQGGVLLGDGVIQKKVVNYGVVAPGYRGLTLTVNDYTQTGQGTLQIGFNSRDQYSVLSANSATLAGSLRFSPSPGFYAENYSINMNSVQATSSTGAFNSVGVSSSSPTLNFSVASSNGLGSALVGQQRASSAYSRYADSTTTSRVGRALYQIAGQATGDMQNLFQALDWSDASGSGIAPAMEQLSPNSYDAVARAGLEAQRQLNLLMVRRFFEASSLQGVSGTVVSRIFRTFCSSQSVKHGFVSSREGSDFKPIFLGSCSYTVACPIFVRPYSADGQPPTLGQRDHLGSCPPPWFDGEFLGLNVQADCSS